MIKIAELNNGIGGTTAYTQQSFSEDVHIQKGDLLFSWSGNPKTSIDIFRFKLDEGWLNQHIFKVNPNETLVDTDYFYFLMKNLKQHFTQIATNKQTTGLGHVTISDIKRMSVIVPSLKIQRAIVSYIKPIDDKIELNNEINNNLEQQIEMVLLKTINDTDTQPVKLGDYLYIKGRIGWKGLKNQSICQFQTTVSSMVRVSLYRALTGTKLDYHILLKKVVSSSLCNTA